jgi:serine/threonine-protein kinase
VTLCKLSAGERVKLLDLGLARVSGGGDSSAGNVTQTGQAVGTLYYMSPEQFEHNYVPDQRSDLYAVGASLYHLVAGRPPFAGGSLVEAVRQIRGGQPEPLEYAAPKCPRALCDAIERAMNRVPDLRYPDAMTMQIALSRVQREIQLAGAEQTQS